jgi:hypothetical protein
VLDEQGRTLLVNLRRAATGMPPGASRFRTPQCFLAGVLRTPVFRSSAI